MQPLSLETYQTHHNNSYTTSFERKKKCPKSFSDNDPPTVGQDKDQIEDETERNKHVFAVSLKDSAQEGRDNVGRDRDRISNVGRDGTRVPPFKGGTRKLCNTGVITPSPILQDYFTSS